MPIFFGWFVLAGLFLVYAATNGILINSLPLIYPSLVAEFGWDQAEVTRPATIFFVVTGLISPFSGAILDKLSPRTIMVIGVSLIIGALALYTQISALWQLTLIYVVFALGLAMGGLLASMVILTRWFVTYRGLAVGIFLCASSAGGAFFPAIVGTTLDETGWRAAVLLMTLVGGAMMILPLIYPVRNHPRDMGLYADGAAEPPKETPAGPDQVSGGPTLIESIKSPVFYLLAFATATMWFCINGAIQHQALFLGTDIGLPIPTLATLFSVFFVCAVIGKLLFGWLSDHFDKGLIMLIAVINLGVGLVILRLVGPNDIVLAYAYAVVYGIGFSGAFTMIQLMIAELYAGHQYGRILGVFVLVDTLAGAAGIAILGALRVQLGSYLPAFNLMIALCIAAALCVVLMNGLISKKPESAAA